MTSSRFPFIVRLPFVVIGVAVMVAVVVAFYAIATAPSETERIQDHTRYIEKMTPDGKTIPCVTLYHQAITCKFP